MYITSKIKLDSLLYQLSLFITLGLPIVAAAAEDFTVTEVADGIYVHQGQHVGLDAEGRDDIANIGFIIGDNCIAVIDTGGSIAIGQRLLEQIRQTSALPICYVINSHVHFDHVLGNAAFASEKAKFVGHSQLPDELKSNVGFFIDEFRKEIGEQADASAIIQPDVIVDDTLTIDLGNRLLIIRAHPPAHTRTDLSVYDKKTGTLWLADLLFVERIPVLDGSLKGWLNVMQEFRELNPGRVIPGHGSVDYTPGEAIQAQQVYLETLLNETRQFIQQGAFMEEVIDKVGAQEKLKWQLYEQQHKRNISRAFIELEWE